MSRHSALWRASFDSFTLLPSQRMLERDGVPVRLGGRALDLLIVLVDSAGQTVSKTDLIARVWPNTVVDEGTLRFHMVAVRKALGEGVDGKRYVVNTASKGYTFVAEVERSKLDVGVRPATVGQVKSLPALGAKIVGRDTEVDAIVTGLLERRLVSVVGSGGIGKTTVAIASARAASDNFEGDVHFVDLSAISTKELVCSSVSAVVGLQSRLDELPVLVGYMSARRSLIVLDCCEHVIDGAAEVAEALCRGCPEVHILATSREPLRSEDEFVYRLPPLAYPTDGNGTTAEDALTYPAVRLFVERAAASGCGFVLSDSDAPLASQLCRELDGIALAIELAAGRIEAIGLKAITSHFDASARLMWHGRRTAVPRQQTLSATLDWSYELLEQEEQRLLRRLSVFAGTFSLEAVIAVCCSDLEKSTAVELLAGLVSKSLVNVDAGGTVLRYSLLDTTKAYASSKLVAVGEADSVAGWFAAFFYELTHRFSGQPVDKEVAEILVPELPNIRAALRWYFGHGERASEAIKFAASFCPLLLQRVLLAECARWAYTALALMPADLVGSRYEASLQVHSALGQTLNYSGRDHDDASAAFHRGVDVTEHLKDHKATIHLLNGHALSLHRSGLFAQALSVARKAESLLPKLHDPEYRAIVDSLVGGSLHLVGEVEQAGFHLERSVACSTVSRGDTSARLGFDDRVRALTVLSRNVWLQGQHSRAISLADRAIAEGRATNHAVSRCMSLLWAGFVYGWQGDVDRHLESVAELEEISRLQGFTPHLAAAGAVRGKILIEQGRAAEGVERIRVCLETLHANRFEKVTSLSLTAMAAGLSALSLHSASLELCDKVAKMIEDGGDFLRMPELLTVQGWALAAAGHRDEATRSVEAAFVLAGRLGMKAAQVRAAVSRAQLWGPLGRAEKDMDRLRECVSNAGEEISPDLSIARALLSQA